VDIGLDEDGHQVTGASDVELADWWAQATVAFDEEIVPGLTGLMVPVGPNESVVALYMTTERAPYLVNRQVPQGPLGCDFPWSPPQTDSELTPVLRTHMRPELIIQRDSDHPQTDRISLTAFTLRIVRSSPT
jgi:hypothetical protein